MLGVGSSGSGLQGTMSVSASAQCGDCFHSLVDAVVTIAPNCRGPMIGVAVFSLLAAAPSLASAETCADGAARANREIAAARAQYSADATALFRRYNSKINSDLSAASRKYLPQLQNPEARGNAAALRAQYATERKVILEQWNDYRKKKHELLLVHAFTISDWTEFRDESQPGRCNNLSRVTSTLLRTVFEGFSKLVYQPKEEREQAPVIGALGFRG